MSKRNIALGTALAIGALALDVAFYNLLVSHYALNHLWTPNDTKPIELVGVLIIAAGTSLVIGYLTKSLCFCIAPHLIAFTAPQALMRLPVLQGFVLPTALIAALMFGWIGAKLGKMSVNIPDALRTE